MSGHGGFEVTLKDEVTALMQQVADLKLQNVTLGVQLAQCAQLLPQMSDNDPVGRKPATLIFANEKFKFEK